MYAWFSVIPVLGAATGNERGHLQMNTVKRLRKEDFKVSMEEHHYSESLKSFIKMPLNILLAFYRFITCF